MSYDRLNRNLHDAHVSAWIVHNKQLRKPPSYSSYKNFDSYCANVKKRTKKLYKSGKVGDYFAKRYD